MRCFAKVFSLVFISVLLAGVLVSCKKDPVGPPDKPDTSKCDTCHTDTTKCDTCTTDTLKCDTCNVPCDTCDTTHHQPPGKHDFTWTEYFIPGEAEIAGVIIFSPNDIYANGNYMYHFDGTKWEKVQYYVPPHRPISGVISDSRLFGFTANDYWIAHGGIIHHVTGFEEAIEYRFPTGQTGYSIWGTSSNNIFSVGNYGVIMHYDGTNWTQFPKITEKNLQSVWGTSSSNIWAAGWNQTTGESVLLHYDGSSWQEIPLSNLGDIGVGSHGLIGVWACDSAGKKLTYACGSFVYRSSPTGVWRIDTLDNSLGANAYAALNFIRGNGPDDFMVGGGGGYTAHWDGKTWKSFKELFHWNDINYDAYGLDFKGNTACVVGTKGGRGWITVGQRE